MRHQYHKRALKQESGIGASIRHVRKDRDITLMELSNLTGLDYATLSRIETGKRRLTVRNLLVIAEALKIDAKRFLNRFEDQKARRAV